jgi:hypothetical protein
MDYANFLKQHSLRGAVTVEMAIVLPIIAFVLTASWFMRQTMEDRALFRYIAYTAGRNAAKIALPNSSDCAKRFKDVTRSELARAGFKTEAILSVTEGNDVPGLSNNSDSRLAWFSITSRSCVICPEFTARISVLLENYDPTFKNSVFCGDVDPWPIVITPGGV